MTGNKPKESIKFSEPCRKYLTKSFTHRIHMHSMNNIAEKAINHGSKLAMSYINANNLSKLQSLVKSLAPLNKWKWCILIEHSAKLVRTIVTHV